MEEQVRVNKKCVKDPLYVPIMKFLKQRLETLKKEGPEEELLLAEQRYNDLLSGDLVIEEPVVFDDGKVQACFVARKNGFARVDVVIDPVEIDEVFTAFSITPPTVSTLEDFVNLIRKGEGSKAIYFLEWLGTYGVVLSTSQLNEKYSPMEAFGDLFFKQYETDVGVNLDIDLDTYQSGTVTITDPSIGSKSFPLFIEELVDTQLDATTLRTNLPDSILTQRGDVFNIPLTVWFGEDVVTTEVSIRLSTRDGYAIPQLGDNQESVFGEIIYGSSVSSIDETLIARISYNYKGREYSKTFDTTLKIQQDPQYDLTFKVSPEEIVASVDDIVQVSVICEYKGNQVVPMYPAEELTTSKDWGKLTLLEQKADGVVVYSGKVKGIVDSKEDFERGLYSGTFKHQEDGRVITAPVFFNMKLLKPETKPLLEIEEVTEEIEEEFETKGTLYISALYNKEFISPTELEIRTGVKGDKGLISFDSVTDEGIEYTVVKDPGDPGSSVSDSFDLVLSYTNEGGVRQTVSKTITVKVYKPSNVVVTPVVNNGITVNKYDSGNFPFVVMINGVDKTSEVTKLTVKDPKNYIRIKSPTGFQCLNTGTIAFQTTVVFTWTQYFDGVNNTLTATKLFTVNPYKGGKIAVVPNSITTLGYKGDVWTTGVKVYNQDIDITKQAAYSFTKSSLPSNLKLLNSYYDNLTGTFLLRYSKQDTGTGTGTAVFTQGVITLPTADQMGTLKIITHISEPHILKVTSQGENIEGRYLKDAFIPLSVSFANAPISLLDPNLTISLSNGVSTNEDDYDEVEKIVSISEDGVTVKYTSLLVDGVENGGTILFLSYNDNGTDVKTSVNITRNFLAPVLTVTNISEINAKIWDTGIIPLAVLADGEDITGRINKVSISGNSSKYVTIDSSYIWEIINANKEASRIVVPLTLSFYDDDPVLSSVGADVVFNLEAWDGIKFSGKITPESINLNSGESGELIGNFTYKGNDGTQNVTLDLNKSIVPDTIKLGSYYYKNEVGLVIPYSTINGGVNDLHLSFLSQGQTDSFEVDIPSTVIWNNGINILKSGDKIAGNHTDLVEFPLEFNVNGVPHTLTDPNVSIKIDSGIDNPVTLFTINEKGLSVSLNKGGDLGATYNYTTIITLTYDGGDDARFTKELSIPTSIHINNVAVKNVSSILGDVYTNGKLSINLIDDAGTNIDPIRYQLNEISENVSLDNEGNWEIISGDVNKIITGYLSTRVYFTFGGGEKYLDFNIPYTINKFDGYVFKSIPSATVINGDSGTIGELNFSFLYMGNPTTDVNIDLGKSVIPNNIVLGDYINGNLKYSLRTHGTETLKIAFVRNNESGDVENVNWTSNTFEVTTRSTNEELVISNYTKEIKLNWENSVEITATLKYGDTDLVPNSPGLKWSIKESGDKSFSINAITSSGIKVTAKRSDGPDTTRTYSDILVASYDLGDDVIKQVELPVDITITTGIPVIQKNVPINTKVWSTGIFPEEVYIDGIIVPDVKNIVVKDKTKYIKMTSVKSYEVVGWENETGAYVIPMTLTYLLDNVEYGIDFDATFTIAGYTGSKFYVDASQDNINMGINQTASIGFTPMFKDLLAGNKATFKQELSTIPTGLSIKSITSGTNGYTITFQGDKSGTYSVNLVFWSPEAVGPNPEPQDVYSITMESVVLGELGIEIGDRSNRLVGGNGDTGSYTLEMLFGGETVPLTDSNLVISVDKGESTSMNANVISITKLGTTSFEYALTGVVSPGSTVDVSDFITLSYTFNNKVYTRSVEIPLTYTSPVITTTGLDTLTSSIWKTIAVAPAAMCGDINISGNGQLKSATFIDGTTKDKYLEVVKNTSYTGRWDVTVYNAETTKTSYTAKFKLMGVYRNWTWYKEIETVVTLDAWDGNYITAKLLDTSAVMSGTTGKMASSAFEVAYKNSIPVGSNTITVDESRSEFFGTLVTTEVRNTTSKVTILSTVLNGGTGTLRYCLMMPNPPANPKEGVDYIMVGREYSFKEKAIAASGNSTVTGGQDDVISLPLKLLYDGVNVPINDGGLIFTIENNTYITLTGNRTETALEALVTAPWDTVANGTYTVKINVSYTDSSNKTATTSFTQSVTIKRPADWPVVKNVTSATLDVNAWDAGPCPFIITSNGVDITSQAKPISLPSSGITTLDPDYENNGNWWFISRARGAATGVVQKPTFTFQVPYRGKYATLTGQQGFKLLASSSEIIPFKVTTINGIGESTVGTEGEFAFTVLYQNRPYTNVKAVVKTSGIYTLRGPNGTVGNAAGTTTVTPIRVEGNTIYIGYKSITGNSSTGVALGLMLGTSTTTAISSKVDGDTVSLSFLPGVVGTNITSPVVSNTDPQPLPFSLVTTTGTAVNNYTLLTVSDDLSYLMVGDGNTFSANGIPTDGDKVTNVTFGITLPSGYSKTYIEVKTTVTLKAEV